MSRFEFDSVNLKIQWPRDGKVIKAGQAKVYEDAEQILRHAKMAARRLEAESRQAYEEQRRRGYRDGLAEGQAEAARQMARVLGQTIEYLNDVEKSLASVVLYAIRKMLGEFPDEALTEHVVRQAIKVVQSRQQATLRVATEMVEKVRVMLEAEAIDWIRVEGEPDMGPGQCLLECGIGMVEGNLERQLDAITEAVSTAIYPSPETPDPDP